MESENNSMNLQYSWDGLLPDGVKRAPGLYNSRNDCFINSVLQFVFHTPQLIRLVRLNQEKHECEDKSSCLQCVLSFYYGGIGENIKAFDPKDMRKVVNEQFSNRIIDNQEDAHEMLIFLFSKLEPPLPKNEDKSAPKPPSPTEIDRIFGGKMVNKIKCTECPFCQEKREEIREFNLNLMRTPESEKALQLEHFIKSYFETENLDDYKCDNCIKRGSIRKLWIEEAPNVLVIQLERFRFDGSKIQVDIDIPLELDLTKHMFSKKNTLRYKLYGFISHYGRTVNSGHYTCTFLGYDAKWYKFDDDVVCDTDPASFDTKSPYLLFYYKE